MLLGWAFAAAFVLVVATYEGLGARPDMQVEGLGSTPEALHWYQDRVEAATPAVTVVSAPPWTWKAIMFAWALWLAQSLLRWTGWGWRAYGTAGLWRPLRTPEPDAPPAVAAVPDAPADEAEGPSPPPGPDEV